MPKADEGSHSRGVGHRSVQFAIATFLLLTLPLHAALTSSALTGHVTVTNARADGVTVTALSRATQLVRTTTTNARGRYFLGAMAPGEYDVTFARAGLSSVTRPATVELGRVARADAQLEPNDDEESVASTAITVSVADTTAITTHFSADELERVPLRRDLATATALSPVLPGLPAIIDDTVMFFPALLGEEALDEVTVVRGAQPIELAGGVTGVILARTRSGSDTIFLSLRDTYSTLDGGGHVLESASGGRVVTQRLWFFASGWGGDATDVNMHKLRGLTLKLDAQAAAAHHFTAAYNDADARFSSDRSVPLIGTTAASLRYTGVLEERLTAEAVFSRSEADLPFSQLRDDAVDAKVSYRIGDHVVSAGGQRSKHPNGDVDAVYLGDRWTFDRWTVDAGLRRDGDRTLTRAAAAFDLRSSTGSHAIVASWGEYLPDDASGGVTQRQPGFRVASIGYTSSLESSGAARIDLLHYDFAEGNDMDQVQLDARYRLFDRFLAGASYVYTRVDPRPLFLPEHLATVVLGLQLPVGGRELGATVLEHYDARSWTTGIGVRYEIPIRRVSLTLAGDATNVFDSAVSAFSNTPERRGLRFWARIRR